MGEPKLRFKADDGSDFPNWEEKTLGELCEPLTYGMNAAATKFDGENRYIRITDIDDETHAFLSNDVVSPSGELDDKYLVKKGDILLARTGASTGKSYLYHPKDGKLFYAGFLIKAHVLPSSDDYFIYSQTLTDRYGKWVKTTSMRSGQPGINANEYASYSFSVPSLPEQRKIADLLSAVDDVISAQEAEVAAWEKRKKGVMQKLFSQEVRFKADDGSDFPDWEEKTLGDVGSVAMCKRVFKEQTREVGDVPFFKIGTFGDVPDAYISKSLFDELKSKYAYPKVGTILLSASGTIGRQVEYNGEDAYYQDSNIVWLEHDDTVLDSYLKQFYSVVKWQGLEGSTIKRLYNKTILDTPFYRPSLPEQRKIAECLALLDDVIAKAKDELDAWRELKKGLLQQMFV